MMTSTDDDQRPPITVLGLGDMGSAIARVFVAHGHDVTVWNRTESKAGPLVASGASLAKDAAEAVAASPLTVLCVLDYEAVEAVLADTGAALEGKTLVNVTSGSPERARGVQRWATERGASYLDGGVMGDPPDLGTGHVRLSLSGSGEAYATYEPVLREPGTPASYGVDAGLASVEFMAQVAVGYELLLGFLHTLHLIAEEGVDPAAFASRVADSIDAYPGLLRALGQAVRDGEYPPDLGPLSVQVALMDDMIKHRESLGVDVVRMREVRERMRRRVVGGHADQGFSSLIVDIRGQDG